VFWVNSGSEATDLALRLARAHTHKRGVITVGGAYHGHLLSVIDISPYKYAAVPGGTGRRPHVREAPIPDAFSGRYRGRVDDPAVGAAYAAEVAAAAADLTAAAEREGRRRAAVAALLAAGVLKPQPAPSVEGVAAAAAAKPSSPGGTPRSPSAPAASPPGGSGSRPVSPAAGSLDAGAAAVTGSGSVTAPTSSVPDAVSALLASLDEYATDDDGLTAGCGAFICESVLSCGGQVVLPAGAWRRLVAACGGGRAGVCDGPPPHIGTGSDRYGCLRFCCLPLPQL
jgi:4-aminobutyrate aminotransferase-like enzyme